MTLEYRMIANSSTFLAFSSPIICLTRIIGVVWGIVDEIGGNGRDWRKGLRKELEKWIGEMELGETGLERRNANT
jgi:hypothetical protein